MHPIYEDNYLIIINKPAGLQTEPDTHGYPNLLDTVREYLEATRKKKPVFIQPVHRLDRPVSGLVLFALRPMALKNLNALFARRHVEKTYLAITTRRFQHDSGTLIQYLKKDPAEKKALVRDTAFRDAVQVQLDFEFMGERDPLFLWKIRLHTGKYHQIRAQFAHLGCPILGDVRYGSDQDYIPEAIALHAVQLGFDHPVSGEHLTIRAPLPENIYWDRFRAEGHLA